MELIFLVNVLGIGLVLTVWSFSSRLIPFAANHLNVYSLVWGSLVIGYQIVGLSVIRPFEVFFFYTVWVFFLFGSVIPLYSRRFYRMRHLFFVNGFSRFDLQVLKILLVFLFAMFLLSNLDILKLDYIKDFSFENMAKARMNHSLDYLRSNNLFYTVFGTNVTLIVPLVVLLRSRNCLSRGSSLFMLVVFILVSIAGFTRAPLFALFIVLVTSIYFFQSRKDALRMSFFGFTAIILFFIFSSSILSVNQSDWSLLDDIKVYYFGGISALTNVMSGKYVDYIIYDFKLYSFDFILYPAKVLGLVDSYPSVVREYDVNFPTNVYTYLDSFILDFGLLGGVLGSFVLGLMLSFCLLMLRYLGVFALVLYVNFLYYISFIFMNNEFIRFGSLLLILKVCVMFLIFTVVRKVSKL